MKGPFQISVALVTRNRPESLRRCLTSLRAQDVQPWEVVVSDDSDDQEPGTQLAAEFGAIHRVGPKRGLYANRNSSALACNGTHIRTMDDDHLFPVGHFRLCAEAVESDPHAVWTCGEKSFLDGVPYDFNVIPTQLHPSGVGCGIENPDDSWGVSDGVTIYPKMIFDAGFRWCEEFGFGSSYLEFGALLYFHDWKTRCIQGAYVEHYAQRETIMRTAWDSILYASLCYNLRFKPSRTRALKNYLTVISRCPSLIFQSPRLLKIMRGRWDSNLPRRAASLKIS